MAQPTLSRFRRATLAIKQESSYSADVGTTAANVLEAFDVSFAVGQEQFRDERLSGTIYARPDIPGVRTAQLSGKVLLRGANAAYTTGVTPEIHDLMQALGATFTLTTSTGSESYAYTPQTGATIGASVTADLYTENAPSGKVLGAFGTGRIIHELGKPTILDFTLQGQYQSPASTTLVTITPSQIIPPTFKSAALTISTSSHAPRVSQITVDLGNSVQYVADANSAPGYAGAVIENKRATITLDPEQSTGYDWHSKRDTPGSSGWGDPISFQTGATQYNRIKFRSPRMQVLEVGDGNRNGVRIFNIGGKLNAATSENEWTLTFD